MKILGKDKKYKYNISDTLFVSTCNKSTFFKYTLYLTFSITFGLVCLLTNINKTDSIQKPLRYKTDLKYVLMWQHNHSEKKKDNSKKYNYKMGQSSFINQNCKYINCYLTSNKSLLKDEDNIDAVVFDVHDVAKYHHGHIGLKRNSNQKYIFHSVESSEKHPVCNPLFDDFFNLTWTYKLNSDLPHPYFNVYDKIHSLIGPKVKVAWSDKMNHIKKYHNQIREKTKAVAWILTKCSLKKKHQDFVKELRNELQGYNYTLDIFGPCSKTTRCPDNNIDSCYEMVEKEYFFSLILEDSYADDYLTDKVIKTMTHVVLPILLSGANYSRFLPPGSFIDVLSFDIKKLGAVIDYLIKTPQMYEYFFDWKKHYYYKERPKSFLCDLCAKLNLHEDHQSYNEFRKWWNPDYPDICEKIRLVELFRKT